MRQAFKNIFTLPLAAVTALLLAAGCDKQAADAPVTGFPEDGVVRVSADGAATRADGESLYLGTNLGLYIDYGTGDRHTMANVRWTKGTSDWTPDSQMLWKDATTPAALYAYAPYIEGETNAESVRFYIPSDQTSGTVDADFVYWKSDAFVPNDSNDEFVGGKVQITFNHILTKLTLNFEKASQFASDVTVEEVVLKDARPFVIFSMKEDNFKAIGATAMDIKMHKIDDFQYDVIFYPGPGQLAGSRRMLEVTMSDGTVLFYNVPSDGLVSGGLQTGKAYSMNMMLGKDKIEVIDAIRVNDWTDDDPFDSSEAEIDETSWDGRTIATSFESGTGTETDPFIIAKASQLAYLAQSVNSGESYSGKYFRQTSNLSLSNEPWTPIGDNSHPFSGNFDGDGNAIRALSIIAETAVKYSGLFGYAQNGSIKNLRMESASISINNTEGKGTYAALLCGAASKVSVSGCSVEGEVIAPMTSLVGGIIGDFVDESEMSRCVAKVTVKGSNNVGGLCGCATSSNISDCSVVDCRLESTSYRVGGVAGLKEGSNGKITNCTVSGIIKGITHCGGLVGRTIENGGEVSGCTSKVEMSVSGNDCGGLVGNVYGLKLKFTDCGFDGTITKSGSNVYNLGAAVGYDNTGTTFTGCWYNADKAGDIPVVGKSEGNAEGKDYSGIEAKHLGK